MLETIIEFVLIWFVNKIVGYGINGTADYADSAMYPFPAIRFKEDDAAISKLREKEKGDWKKMTVAEKKELYRASFCLTFAEFKSTHGDWKGILGGAFLGIAIVTSVFMTFKWFGKSLRRIYRLIR